MSQSAAANAPARQAKRCCVINLCARDAISLSQPAAAAARICFEASPLRPRSLVQGARRCGTSAFDAGTIGGRDQIHAAHGRTYAEHGKSIIGNWKMQPVTGD